ncbi:MAG: hypothetical protein EA398_16045 [Deltaproteobacteria bacterium]|nr:MAG: hypothetical protein EA398_16045 [Deltaproteobacteria bacterium]
MSTITPRVPTEETLACRSTAATELLRNALGDDWTITQTNRGARARFRLLTVSLKYHPENDDGAWRCRLRDSFPRRTLIERRADGLREATDDVVARALHARAMIGGDLGLAQTPAKSWLAYRVWSAVRNPG